MTLEGKRASVDSDTLRDKEANSQRGRATTAGTEKSKDSKTMGNVKFVFDFEEGDGKNKQLLGGKGSGLVEMTQIGLPIPCGFVITTEACRQYYAKRRKRLRPSAKPNSSSRQSRLKILSSPSRSKM